MSSPNSTSSSTSAGTAANPPFRVMVVDDSAVIRGLVTRILEAENDILVVASVGDGSRALKALENDPSIEVVLLDIEMPVMDGLTTLPRLLEIDPNIKVVMSSTLTLQNADVSMRAMSMGAADYIPKPTSMTGVSGSQDFRRDVIEKVRVLGSARREKSGMPDVSAAPQKKAALVKPKPGDKPEVRPGLYRNKPIVLRETSPLTPLVVAIGSSTGGPQALFELFEQLGNSVKLPIFITQHMPPTFTTILAERINRLTGGNCKEAVDGEPVLENRVYVAPGDYHMRIKSENGDRVVQLDQSPPENFCRPAVDPMYRSMATAYGGRVLGVILTGMGSDGFKGGEKLIESGGTIIAQDDDTSVVWGMPGAVATGGLCSAVLPIKEIAPAIKRLVAGEKL